MRIFRGLISVTGLRDLVRTERSIAKKRFADMPVQSCHLNDPEILAALTKYRVMPTRSVVTLHQELMRNLDNIRLRSINDEDVELPYPYGVEFRSPYTDHRLIDLITRMASECFSKSGVNRRLMRKLVERSGNPDIAERPTKYNFSPSFLIAFTKNNEKFFDLINSEKNNDIFNYVFEVDRIKIPNIKVYSDEAFQPYLLNAIKPSQVAYFLSRAFRIN